MFAEIVAVGDELSSGQRLDTNSQWLSQRLSELGCVVTRHTTIGDQMEVNISALREAAARCQVLVISGGLGPTQDDLTRQALAEAFNRPLQLDLPSLEHIQQLFARRGRGMPERNRIQAMFPSGALTIPNPFGSAPGIDMSVNLGPQACRIFALPGVPAELKQMWHETVQARIDALQADNRGSMFFHSVKLFGLGESDVEARVPTLIARDRVPTVGITVSQATITLRIAARAKSHGEFQQLIAPTVREIHEQLGELIFGYEEDDVADALLRTLYRHQQTLACVEIGGVSISSALHEAAAPQAASSETTEPLPEPDSTSAVLAPTTARVPVSMPSPPATSLFRGGAFFVDLNAANRWLSINLSSRAPAQDAPEQDTWMALARHARDEFNASIGIAVGVYPSAFEIQQHPPGKPFNFVIAISSDHPQLSSRLERQALGGHPDVLSARLAKTAMELLRKGLAG